MLVVLEGPDGGGKTTLCAHLARKGAKTFKYPTKKFSILTDYLEGRVSLSPKSLFLLFLADIADEQRLLEGDFVLLDRYVFSTIAYEVDGISYEEGKQIVEAVGFKKPDLVILLDVPPEVSLERKRKQKALDRYEKDTNYLEKVRANFLSLYKERFLTPNWHKINATKPWEEVVEEVERVLRSSRMLG